MGRQVLMELVRGSVGGAKMLLAPPIRIFYRKFLSRCGAVSSAAE